MNELKYHTCHNCGSTFYRTAAPDTCPDCGKAWIEQARPGKSPKDTRRGEAGYLSTTDVDIQPGASLPASSSPRDGKPTVRPPK